MPKVRIVRPTTFDIQHVAYNMRDVDRREVAGVTDADLMDALADSIGMSTVCCAALVDEVPVAIYGIAGFPLSRKGAPWLLGTNDMLKNLKRFAKGVRQFMAFAHENFDELENYVSAENEVSIHWLEHLGFTVDRTPLDFGRGVTFYKFSWRRIDDV